MSKTGIDLIDKLKDADSVVPRKKYPPVGAGETVVGVMSENTQKVLRLACKLRDDLEDLSMKARTAFREGADARAIQEEISAAGTRLNRFEEVLFSLIHLEFPELEEAKGVSIREDGQVVFCQSEKSEEVDEMIEQLGSGLGRVRVVVLGVPVNMSGGMGIFDPNLPKN